MAGNKDYTFSPRFYAEEKILIQTEYRQKDFKTDHVADFSFLTKKNGSSKSHLFYELDQDLVVKKFDTGDFNFKFQTMSNDTYIRSNNIKGDLIKESNILENSINLDLYSNDLSIHLNSTMYEDLDKTNGDRYEYILPKFEITKNIDGFDYLNGDFSLISKSLIRNYNTNIYEKNNINDLIKTIKIYFSQAYTSIIQAYL